MKNASIKTDPPQPAPERYGSLDELMAATGVSADTQKAVRELAKGSQLTRHLAALRTTAGLTQAAMAERLDCTQSCISKLEAGADEDVTMKQLRAYAEATGQSIGVAVGQRPNHVEAIKNYAAGIHYHLQALAKLAHQDEELEAGIQSFYNEALLNILDIIGRCQNQMPHAGKVEIRVEVSTGGKAKRTRKAKAVPVASKSKGQAVLA